MDTYNLAEKIWRRAEIEYYKALLVTVLKMAEHLGLSFVSNSKAGENPTQDEMAELVVAVLAQHDGYSRPWNTDKERADNIDALALSGYGASLLQTILLEMEDSGYYLRRVRKARKG